LQFLRLKPYETAIFKVAVPKSDISELPHLYSDIMIIIGGAHVYHLEAQIGDDTEMVLRVFEYGFHEGQRTKSATGDKITVSLPQARIIYWETSPQTPDEVTLELVFPDGSIHNYQVETFKFLDHGLKELEERKMVLLLPFYILKLRKAAAAAQTGEKRKELSREMKNLLEELFAITLRNGKTGILSSEEVRLSIGLMERLYNELYKGYIEFEEADAMLQAEILTREEMAEIRAEKRAREQLQAEILTREEMAEIRAEKRVRDQLQAEILTREEMAEIRAEKRIREQLQAEIGAEKRAREQLQAEILTREWEQKQETVRKMKAEGLSFEQIGRISGLSAGEIEEI
jgi:hypothetical protein